MEFWILDQLDQALLFQPRPEGSGNPDLAVSTLSVGDTRRLNVCHRLQPFLDTSNPLYAALLWKGLKSGLRTLPFLSQADSPVRRPGRDSPESIHRFR
jgi:hypothetical protein